jgi:hypothetical protein
MRRLCALDVRVDDRLTAALAWGALLLGGKFQINSHISTTINLMIYVNTEGDCLLARSETVAFDGRGPASRLAQLNV